jgi:hypothetical protein
MAELGNLDDAANLPIMLTYNSLFEFMDFWHFVFALFVQVNDNDLSKELYKKYSSVSPLLRSRTLPFCTLFWNMHIWQVHRRKVRVWQMLCVLSYYVEEDIVEEVTSSVHICLYVRTFLLLRVTLLIYAIVYICLYVLMQVRMTHLCFCREIIYLLSGSSWRHSLYLFI